MSGSRTAIPNLNEILRDNETATSPDTEFDTTPDSAVFPPNEFVSTRASRPMFPNLPTSLSSNRRPSVIRLGSATDIANEARQYDELLNTDSDNEVESTSDQEANEVFGEDVFEQPLFEPHDRYHHHHHLRQSGEDFVVGARDEGPGRGEDTAVSFEIGPLRPNDGANGGRGMTNDDEASPPDTGGVLGGLSLRGVGSARAFTDVPPTSRRPLYPIFQAVDRRERDGSGGGGGGDGEQEDAVRMTVNRSSYPPLLPDHRGHPTAIHLGRRHPLSPPSAHWNANRSGNRSGSRLPPVPRSGAYSGATTPREAHFGLHVHSHQQRPAASSANTNTADNAAAELPFSVAAPEGWQIVPRSNGDQQNRYQDGTRAAPILLTQFSSDSSEAEDEPGDCSSPVPPEWRASCKDSRARFKHVLESELFADVCFLFGASGASNRPNTSISRWPSRLPTLSRQATFSNDTSDRKQRMISSMIAQVSGCVSRGQASPPAGAIGATAADEPTAAEKAQRLTELLLAMNIEQSTTTAEGMLQPSDVSLDPSPSSSSAASSVPTSSPLTEQGDQPSVAVMCDMTDTSDIDSDNRQVETTSTCTQTPTNAHTFNSQARPGELGEGSEATAVATATANAASGPVSATSVAGGLLLKVDEPAAVDGPTPKNVARPDSPDSTSPADFRDGDQLQQQSQQQQEPKRFYAHRLLLALASPVFEAMFFGMFTENRVCTRFPASVGTAAAGGNTRALSSKSDILELPISDVTPKAFHQCLRFIYYDDLQLSDDIDELYDILYAAKKYLLPQLASASASQLIKHMTPENVLFQLNKCSAIDEEELTRICWRTIDLMTSEVLASEPFVDLYKETVVELISRDTLCCKEWEIFEAVHRWARAECDRRGLSPTSTVVAELMTDFLPLIRFTTMSLGDFVLHVAKSGVLSLELQRDISVFIATEMFSQEESSKKNSDTNGDWDGESNKPVSSTNQTPVNLAISAVPRSGPPLFRCLRSSHAMVPMSKEGYWQEPEAVAFEVSSNVFLAGIGVSEPVGRGSSLKLKIEVRRCSIRQSVRAETGTRYHTVGVSTPVHRHSHQSHSVSTQAFYFQRPGEDSRRRMLRSVGGGGAGGNGSSVGYRPSLQSSPDQSNLRGSSGRSGLKLLVNRGHALGSIETVVRGSGSRPVAQIRFPKPILLKAGKTYVLIAKPEDARRTRCYVHMNVTRTEVRVRTRPSKQNEKSPSVAASWFPLAVPKHVVFHFWYCDKSQTNCSTEGNHIPEILFCPPT